MGMNEKKAKLIERAALLSSKKIIAFDLDGTLTKSKTVLDEEMAALLCRLMEKKTVAILGGGGFSQFKNQFLKHLTCAKEQFKNLFILPVSGGSLYLYKSGQWRLEYSNTLSAEEKEKITHAFESAYRDINYISPQRTYGEVLEDRESQITFSALGQQAPLDEKKKWNKKSDYRPELKAALEKYLPDFEVRFGGRTSLDVTKKGINKAYGIGQVMDMRSAVHDDVVYVGDQLHKGGNDYVVKSTGVETLEVKDAEETKLFIGALLNGKITPPAGENKRVPSNQEQQNTKPCDDPDSSAGSLLRHWGPPFGLILFGIIGAGFGWWSLLVQGLFWGVGIIWIGIWCYQNGKQCGTVHCKIVGYIFPPLGVLGILVATQIVRIEWSVLNIVLIVTVIGSFIPELLGRSDKKREAAKGTKDSLSPLVLSKAAENPIIEPVAENTWESYQTFNPGVVMLHDKVHFVYRAIGVDGISRLGYALSDDGLGLTTRLPYSVYKHYGGQSVWSYYSFASGGSWGGCEDPRMTYIQDDDRIYMTYTACDGGLRVGLTSITVQDFLNNRWRWSRPALISPPGEVHKNWVIFPEKINGKYAILHSINPEISIAYVDNLQFRTHDYIKSNFGSGKSREKNWDDWIRGAGPPPLKTKYGWLLLYHAMDRRDPDKYKVGALLLDLKNPAKILQRSPEPILEPTEPYENNGFKAGVVYASGVVVKDGNLMVYYGCSDSYVAVASANLEEFLAALRKGNKPGLKSRFLKK